jgi:serpin B
MKPASILLAAVLTCLSAVSVQADSIAVNAINALGLDLLRQTATTTGNALLSPYSIQLAMAMTCAGADGETRAEMVRVLHYPPDESQVDHSFAALQTELAGIMARQAAQAMTMQKYGVTNQPLTLTTANRLFGQSGYQFRPAFLDLLKDTYLAPFEPVDFVHDATGVTTRINAWVEQQTRDRIQDLIPADALSPITRLVLVNAIYLKAPWQEPFKQAATQPLPFQVPDVSTASVPTMFINESFGYSQMNGYRVVVIPYAGRDLQFVILLPDAPDGLAALKASVTPEMLTACANLPEQAVNLYLPKFKLEPPVLSLSKALQSLGMTTAFNQPSGSANFDRMAPRRPDDYLYISDIFHKTFLKLDESGTEAAAATAVVMARFMGMPMNPPQPVEVRVDHPFLFAIQHRASGACLFLGQVTDPR